MMLRNVIFSLAVFPLGIAVAERTGTHTLTVTADSPSVSVSPQPVGRHFFNLPSLEYAFQLEARCDDDWEAESLFLSVADTRTSLSKHRLHESPDLQIQLHVPAEQIAPVVLREFCVIDAREEGSGTAMQAGGVALSGNPPVVTYGGALSAQASLRCSKGAEQQTVYVAKPLDVELSCEPGVSSARRD
ncbi:MAG: hypothetical protein WD448_13325 [Woeseia sp.]